MRPPQRRDVLVIGGTLAGAAGALAAVRSGARTRLLVAGCQAPPAIEAIPTDPTDRIRQAQQAYDVPLPEQDLQVFRFRARRVRRWLEELDIDNDEGWAGNLHAAILERLEREGCAVDEVAVPVRLVGSKDDGIAGAVLVDGQDCTVHEADTTLLAGGGARFLWPAEDRQSPVAGLAMAVRAELDLGDLGLVAWQEDAPVPFRFPDAVRGDAKGRCGVRGLALCGQPLASPLHGDPGLAYLEDVVRGLEAGELAAPPAPKADPELVPLVDDPMPPGFSQVKLSRLRATLEKLAGPQASQDQLQEAHAELLSMRGEFADYARARADTEVHLLHQAADVALGHVASRLEG